MLGSGTIGDPYIIQDVTDLQNVNLSLAAYYELGNDIDASETKTWNAGAGFLPIGSVSPYFTGQLDGKGYKVSELYQNTTFAAVFYRVDGKVMNVGFTDLDQTGSTVGCGIAYAVFGTIEKSYTTGAVKSNLTTGGALGFAYAIGGGSGAITDCYSWATCTAHSACAFLGSKQGDVTNCYGTGLLTATHKYGFLVNDISGSLTSCYWDVYTTGATTSDGGEGRTTSQMKAQATFVGWDFSTIWDIDEGNTYPSLEDVAPVVTTEREDDIAVSSVSTADGIEGYLTVLNDDIIVGTEELSGTITSVVGSLLDHSWAHQDGVLLLGGIDAALDKTLDWTFSNKNILECLMDIQAVVGGYWSVRPGPISSVRYLYLEELEQNKGAIIRAGKNLQSLKIKTSYSDVITRVCPLGFGTGIDQLNLTMLSPVAETATHGTPDASYGYIKLGTVAAGTLYRCYKDWTALAAALPSHIIVYKDAVDNTSKWKQGADARYLRCDIGDYDAGAVYTVSYQHAAYLIADAYASGNKITGKLENPSITDIDALMVYGVTQVPLVSVPRVSYDISAEDLSLIAGREHEAIALGEQARTIDEALSVNVLTTCKGWKVASFLNPNTKQFTFDNFPASLSDRIAAMDKAIKALQSQGLQGVSEDITFSGKMLTICDSAETDIWVFPIPSDYLRCGKVVLTFSQSKVAYIPDTTATFAVTVDGNVLGNYTSLTKADITSLLTLPIMGTTHTIGYRSLIDSDSRYLHTTVIAQVFRKSTSLFT